MIGLRVGDILPILCVHLQLFNQVGELRDVVGHLLQAALDDEVPETDLRLRDVRKVDLVKNIVADVHEAAYRQTLCFLLGDLHLKLCANHPRPLGAFLPWPGSVGDVEAVQDRLEPELFILRIFDTKRVLLIELFHLRAMEGHIRLDDAANDGRTHCPELVILEPLENLTAREAAGLEALPCVHRL